MVKPIIKCEYYNLKSIIAVTLGKYYEGLEALRYGITQARNHNFHELEVKMLVNLSAAFSRLNKFQQAAKFALESLKYDFPVLNSKAYYNLYIINDNLGNDEKVKEYIEKSTKLAEKSGDISCYVTSMKGLIRQTRRAGKKEEAIALANEFEEFCYSHKLELDLCHNKVRLGELYLETGRPDEALLEVDIGMKLSQKHGIIRQEVGLYKVAVSAAIDSANYDLAQKYLNEFFDLKPVQSTEIWTSIILESNIILQEKLEDKEALLKAYERYTQYIETYFESKNVLKNNTQSLEYAENESNEIRQINEDILIHNKELKTISHMMAHDLKTPIRNIGSFVELLDKQIDESSHLELRNHLDFLKLSSSSLYKKLDTAETFLNYKVSDKRLKLNLRRIIQSVFENIDIKNCELKVSGKSPVLHSNHSLIFDLFQNIFDSIINLATQKCTEITVRFLEDNQIVISDISGGIYQASLNYLTAIQTEIKETNKNIYIAFMEKLIWLHDGTFSFRINEASNTELLLFLPDL